MEFNESRVTSTVNNNARLTKYKYRRNRPFVSLLIKEIKTISLIQIDKILSIVAEGKNAIDSSSTTILTNHP